MPVRSYAKQVRPEAGSYNLVGSETDAVRFVAPGLKSFASLQRLRCCYAESLFIGVFPAVLSALQFKVDVLHPLTMIRVEDILFFLCSI